ncbi:MAG: hypothetical protein PF450_16260 [Bacteroidales bacterium]|nr:hypothetical protein [Bacteroidales bacterium]
MMEELAQRAKLQEIEKQDFYAKMNELANKKDMAQKRICELEDDRDRMRHELMIMEERIMEESPELLHDPFMMKMLHHPEIQHLLRHGGPARVVQRNIRLFMERLPEKNIERFRDAGILNKRGEVTPAGMMLLKSLARQR